MNVLLSWTSFEVVLFDPAVGDGVDVYRVSAKVKGTVYTGFFECSVSAEVWDVVSLAVVCLKDSIDNLEVGFLGV